MEVFNLQVLDTGSKVEERYVNLAVRCFEAHKGTRRMVEIEKEQLHPRVVKCC